MNQRMITLVTGMQFSEERLKEIFEVPKTKMLFDQFMQKEENAELAEELTQLLEDIFEMKQVLENYSEKEIPEAKDIMIMEVQVCILSKSVEKVVNGKALNQAICATLKEELKGSDILEEVSISLFEQLMPDMSDLLLMRLLGTI